MDVILANGGKYPVQDVSSPEISSWLYITGCLAIMHKSCSFNTSWMKIHYQPTNNCSMYAWITHVHTLPTSFLRVFIISWFFHKRVGPGECNSQQWARDTREVDKTWDVAEEIWAWWDHSYLFNTSTGFPKLLPLPFPLSFPPVPQYFPNPSSIDSGSY